MKKNKKTKVIIIIISALVCISAALIVLEKTGVTDFYHKDTAPSTSSSLQTDEVPSANPTNTVDYGPPSDDNTTQVPEKNPSIPSETPINNSLSVAITSTRKNSDGSSYLIKAVVGGTESGTCSVTATKGSLLATDNGTIGLSSNQNSCLDLALPIGQLTESGIWNVVVTVTDQNGATASTDTTMEVIL